MPEGPEVLSITDELHLFLTGKVLTGIWWTQVSDKFLPHLPAQLEQVQWPLQFTKVYAKGKTIIMELAEVQSKKKWWFFSGLGMTGYWSYEEDTHTHLELMFESGERIYYVDQRRFGQFDVISDPVMAQSRIDRIKPGWIGNFRLSLEEFRSGLRKYNRRYLVAVLIDQTMACSQIGNYALAEIMYAARLHPEIRIGQLSDVQITTLFEEAGKLLTRSYNEGGMTMRDYRTPNGTKGRFMESLSVYQCQKDPLGNEVISSLGKHGSKRNIWWVPVLQKLP
jgi:formamidopyrimidine-DNA glycosylase